MCLISIFAQMTAVQKKKFVKNLLRSRGMDEKIQTEQTCLDCCVFVNCQENSLYGQNAKGLKIEVYVDDGHRKTKFDCPCKTIYFPHLNMGSAKQNRRRQTNNKKYWKVTNDKIYVIVKGLSKDTSYEILVQTCFERRSINNLQQIDKKLELSWTPAIRAKTYKTTQRQVRAAMIKDILKHLKAKWEKAKKELIEQTITGILISNDLDYCTDPSPNEL
ncbi:hypothetical protein RFI_31006 [Reticulomyxa filosa]|uniref:Uncharacterized protein n=1 Tax=Reticulomyxa filosa TaxID=46433 RepID=X6M0B3_RETFI|nr:hypothetical protein RFI_31006 [Reticulomyxa filosa]|eukprot:ETO06390.1 hypothetical protein RFI_31006 [Reticulomyxa filosa]